MYDRTLPWRSEVMTIVGTNVPAVVHYVGEIAVAIELNEAISNRRIFNIEGSEYLSSKPINVGNRNEIWACDLIPLKPGQYVPVLNS